VGNAMIARAYSAFNTSETGSGNLTTNEYDLNSKIGDPSRRLRAVEVPRRDVTRTILFKVQYIPDSDALVTVWLNPDLSSGNSETSQSPDITTRFKANALFDELHLCHRGSGDGWRFSDLAIATSFSDFVTPHVWERTWFISFTMFVLLTALGYAIWQVDRSRRKRFEREQERWDALHAVERERTRIARDIHDDLGATLSEIRLLSKFAQVPDSPLERIREDMKQIAAKALNSTQALDEIVWAVDPEADTIESFVNYACTFATEYLALADMRCRLDLPTRPPAIYLRADVRHNLFLAFKESITNIIKHASASEVCVKMEIADNTFTVTVSDNGIGMTPEILSAACRSETPGQDGLANMKSRLVSIGGQYEISSTSGQGTTVWLQITLPAS
jgi:signal transduction histidine kinase